MKLQDVHARSFAKSTALTGFQVVDAIPPIEVIKSLNNAAVNFILVGAHALGGWTKKPRATEDVDVVVAAKHHKKAVRCLLAAFPNLEEKELEVVTRLCDRETQDVAVDVMKTTQPLFKAAFRHVVKVSSSGQTYKIPSLEMAVAMKFAPMISPIRRNPDKLQDASDFSRMVESNPDLDLNKLEELGELVYPGGGKDILELVRQVRAGETLIL